MEEARGERKRKYLGGRIIRDHLLSLDHDLPIPTNYLSTKQSPRTSMSIRPFLTTHIPINLPPLRPFHTDRMAALTFHPAACFFPRPREAAATAKQPLHHYCSPLRTLVPRTTRPCLLRARSSNGLPQIGGASFGSSNGIRWNMRA